MTRRSAAFWLVAAACLLGAHDLVYLVQVGPGYELATALRSAGHAYWPVASTLIAAAALVAAALTGWRLHRLGRRARGLPAPGAGRIRFIGLWLRLLVIVAAAFVVQENAEHFVGHNHLPGPAALWGPEYPLALPILAAITLFGALVTSLVRERERALLVRIARGAAWLRRTTEPRALLPTGPRRRRRLPVLSLPDPSRAPPVSVSI